MMLQGDRAGGPRGGRRAAAAMVAALALAAGGCADISPPTRSDVYEWRLFVGDDPVAFHWPESRMPVRIWVEDGFDLPLLVASGAEQWREAFLYDELRYAIAADSGDADIIVRAVAPPPKAQSAIRLGSALAPECSGATDLDIEPGQPLLLTLPIRAYVYPRFDPETPGFEECMALTATHELGHAFGIFQHSPNAADIMYADPVADAPSRTDLTTLEVVYHARTTVQVVDPE